MYGPSCKPLSLLRCQDVHPCRACNSVGYIDGEPCNKCNGTGIAKIRKGSVLYCEVCSKSGKDHLPIMQRDPKTDPPPEPKDPSPPPPAASTKKQTRRERRKSQPA